jgi:hypothetical protein
LRGCLVVLSRQLLILQRKVENKCKDTSVEDQLRTDIYQGQFYNKEFAFALIETIKMLPQKLDAILLADIFQQIARLGAIHPVLKPSPSP